MIICILGFKHQLAEMNGIELLLSYQFQLLFDRKHTWIVRRSKSISKITHYLVSSELHLLSAILTERPNSEYVNLSTI